MSEKTALLVIDAQLGVIGNEAYHRDEVLENIHLLLERARGSGTPVVYVQHNDPWMEPETPMWQIHQVIAPREDEPVVQKEAPDSFYETNLQEELRARGITHLIITGGQTQYCVDTTTRRAVAQGYDVTLVSDAHTTDDSKTLPAEQIVAFYNEVLNGFWAGEHKVQVKATNEVKF